MIRKRKKIALIFALIVCLFAAIYFVVQADNFPAQYESAQFVAFEEDNDERSAIESTVSSI